MFFYVTGFGKFGNILENPSSIVVRDLPNILSQQSSEGRPFHLKHSEIVTVSIEDCDEALERIYANMHGCKSNAEHHVVINCGVADGRPGFDLENIGKNLKDFCIPDERGN